MSPDDVFAAQFWPWPDPAIKRDAHGRVLFVNAAFLAIYGGRVEDWRGNAIGGWPAPQNSPDPFRFETRLPADNGSEQVYDWMEQTMADGNAFALARNVTVFTVAPDPDPGEMAPVVTEQQFTQPPAQSYMPPAEPPAVVAEPSYAAAPAAEIPPAIQALAQEPETYVPEAYAPVAETESAPAIEIPDIPIPDVPLPEIAIPENTDHLTYEAQEAPVVAEPASVPEVAQAQPAPEREYERRALPIENESAVLGNNWRDAVIAKAVGAEHIAEDNSPVEQVEETPAPTIRAERSDGTIRILLAEDNAINALLTRTLLEAEGHTVDTVEDGQLAVDAMKTSSYDLIFMDMRMPNMDGLEATRKIRAMPNVPKNLPIIALTANAFDDDRNACFDSGMNDFMTKPVSAEELSEMVGNWTGAAAQERLAS